MVLETDYFNQIKRLKSQNDLLVKLVASDKAAAETMRAEMLNQLNKVWSKHNTTREASLRETTAKVAAELVDGQHEFEKFKLSHGTVVDGFVKAGREMSGRMDKRGTDGKKARVDALGKMEALASSLEEGLEQVRDVVDGASRDHSDTIGEMTTGISQTSQAGYERLHKGSQAMMATLESLKGHSVEVGDSLRSTLDSVVEGVQSTVGEVLASVRFISFSLASCDAHSLIISHH